jgi:hypothetical protein
MQREQSNNQEQIKKRHPLVCFHQYGEEEDAGDIFTKIKEFKVNRRLKFTHFKKNRIIYFIVSSEDVSDFASVIRFTRSTSNFKLVYKCGADENEAINLSAQKDSFIRIKHAKNTEEDGTESNDVIFTSKLPKNLHIMASRRIFESAGVTFDINKAISDSKKFRYENNEEPDQAVAPDQTVAPEQTIEATATTKTKSKAKPRAKATVTETVAAAVVIETEKNSDDEEEAEKNSDDEDTEKVVVKEPPKKRGRKPASQIARKI